MLFPPAHPGGGHLIHPPSVFRRHGVRAGDGSQGDKPMIRLLLQIAQDQRNRRLSQGDDCLVSGMLNDTGNRGQGSNRLPPLGRQLLKAILDRGGTRLTGAGHISFDELSDVGIE